MTDRNITLVLREKEDLRLEERPILEPAPGEVQIQMERVSICGSDIHFWTTGLLGSQPLESPVVLGHEGSGVVIKLGLGVTNFKTGDRVVIEPAIPCRACQFCSGGRYNLCMEVKGLATPGCDGHIARVFNHAADFCHKLPDCMNFDEGALMEPLAVGVHSTTRGRMKMGDVVLICGCGPIGLMCFMVAKARGAVRVCMTDISKDRLEFAKKMGADHVINVEGLEPEEVANHVIFCLGKKANVSMECTGVKHGLASAVFSTISGGVVVALGLGTPWKEVPILEALFREVDIVGSFRYKDSFPVAISMVESGQIDVKPLVTHKFNILQSLDAFHLARKGLGVKVVIDCNRL